MATKYILHGGNAQDKTVENLQFFSEILRDYPSGANVLLVQFAALPEKQEIYKERHVSQFEDAARGKTLYYQVADVDRFTEQVAWADVVYLCGASGGGATERLITTMRTFDDLRKMFDGKTVAGESAGANCLTSICYSKSAGILHGLGLVPVKSIMHYMQGDELALNGVENKLDAAYLPSYTYKVY